MHPFQINDAILQKLAVQIEGRFYTNAVYGGKDAV